MTDSNNNKHNPVDHGESSAASHEPHQANPPLDGASTASPDARPAKPALKPCAIVAQLNRAYLRAIVQAWEEQNLPLIEALGLPLELAQKLARAPGIIIDRLGQFRSPIAAFDGDALQIERLLQHNEKEQKTRDQVDELLHYGATVGMVMYLTGMTTYEVQSRIHALNIKKDNGHRTTLLSDAEMDLAERVWHEYRHLPPMEHWIAVSKATGISIRRLHASYRKYEIPMPGQQAGEHRPGATGAAGEGAPA